MYVRRGWRSNFRRSLFNILNTNVNTILKCTNVYVHVCKIRSKYTKFVLLLDIGLNVSMSSKSYMLACASINDSDQSHERIQKVLSGVSNFAVFCLFLSLMRGGRIQIPL